MTALDKFRHGFKLFAASGITEQTLKSVDLEVDTTFNFCLFFLCAKNTRLGFYLTELPSNVRQAICYYELRTTFRICPSLYVIKFATYYFVSS